MTIRNSPLIRRRWLVSSFAAVVAVTLGGPAAAAPRLKVERYTKPTPGSDIETGGAWTVVHAPLAVVRRAVQDYRRYDRVMPRLEQSRIVGRKAGATDVYLRAPILNGVVHLWAVVRFSPPQKVGRWEMIVGRYLKGNLRAYHGVWKLFPCSPSKTLVKMEMFADVKVPMPASVVSPELAWIADVAVTSIRDRSECIMRRKLRGRAPSPPPPTPRTGPTSPPAPPPTKTPPMATPTVPPTEETPSPSPSTGNGG